MEFHPHASDILILDDALWFGVSRNNLVHVCATLRGTEHCPSTPEIVLQVFNLGPGEELFVLKFKGRL